MIGVALVPACKKSSDATAPVHAGSADSAEYARTSPDPLAELEHLEGRMRELGLGLPVPPARERPAEKQAEAAEAEDEDDALEESRADQGAEQTAAPAEPQSMPAGSRVERDQPESRCTTVCALNEAICELEVQICSMAKDHGSEPVYSDACERAVDDCELSGDACDTCVE